MINLYIWIFYKSNIPNTFKICFVLDIKNMMIWLSLGKLEIIMLKYIVFEYYTTVIIYDLQHNNEYKNQNLILIQLKYSEYCIKYFRATEF